MAVVDKPSLTDRVELAAHALAALKVMSRSGSPVTSVAIANLLDVSVEQVEGEIQRLGVRCGDDG